MPVITPAQVRAQVLRLVRQTREAGKPTGAAVIGLYAPGDWQGGAELACGEQTYRVVPCRSELQTREAMLDHAGHPLEQSADDPFVVQQLRIERARLKKFEQHRFPTQRNQRAFRKTD